MIHRRRHRNMVPTSKSRTGHTGMGSFQKQNECIPGTNMGVQ